jgi:hypothetical protein
MAVTFERGSDVSNATILTGKVFDQAAGTVFLAASET